MSDAAAPLESRRIDQQIGMRGQTALQMVTPGAFLAQTSGFKDPNYLSD
jgi:hypothetical protein